MIKISSFFTLFFLFLFDGNLSQLSFEKSLRAFSDDLNPLLSKGNNEINNLMLMPDEMVARFSKLVSVSEAFKKDLAVHKENGILLRESSPRKNIAFRGFFFQQFCGIDLFSLGEYLKCFDNQGKYNIEENKNDEGLYNDFFIKKTNYVDRQILQDMFKAMIPILVRLIQAISEDQCAFYKRYSSLISELDREITLEPTHRLVMGQEIFAMHYNRILRKLYKEFLVSFPDSVAFTEVKDSLHDETLKCLKKSRGQLSYLSYQYAEKLQCVKKDPCKLDLSALTIDVKNLQCQASLRKKKRPCLRERFTAHLSMASILTPRRHFAQNQHKKGINRPSAPSLGQVPQGLIVESRSLKEVNFDENKKQKKIKKEREKIIVEKINLSF